MIRVSREFEWDMGHRVTNHKSLCKNPHGHRYKMLVEISGDLNDSVNDSSQGMVLDFGDLKTLINSEIVDKYDHSFMYWKDDAVMNAFANINEDLRFVKVSFVPTAECIVTHIAEKLQKLFADQLLGIVLESVILFETPKCKAHWVRA
jgi:6-pyruvoyltetrahydropterin/6-carboxytetrahydropterin synthase